jgi:hypothetical protein
MQRMPARIARTLSVALLGASVAVSIAARLDDPTPSGGVATPGTAATPVPAVAQEEPTPVPVPDTPEPTEEPEPVPTRIGVTDTPWGSIVDEVPAEWPVFPGAEPADPAEGPASGVWLAPGDMDPVARWYRDTLAELGFTIVNLSSPLEDGTRILDVVTDLPECRIQATFRPAEDATLVAVLYGAGCTGG